MDAQVSLPQLAALLAAPARARMLEALLEGGSRSAIDLAVIADVQPQTASSHLAKLVRAGLLTREKVGRNQFYQLAGAQVADILEALNELLPAEGDARGSPGTDLKIARTCYDHLAGRLGTSLTGAMVSNGFLRPRRKDFELTRKGMTFFSELGVDVEAARRKRRLFARRCLDWTEHRHHLGGALGAALAHRCFELAWIEREADGRALRITSRGRRAFHACFGLAELG